jgi:hypothetical protein
MKHPYYDYSLDDALTLATQLKKDRLLKGMKMTEARTMAPYTIETLPEAIQVMKDEVKAATFNWITGRAALQLLRVANGEQVAFTI